MVNKIEVFQILLDDLRVDINAQNDEKIQPIHLICENIQNNYFYLFMNSQRKIKFNSSPKNEYILNYIKDKQFP